MPSSRRSAIQARADAERAEDAIERLGPSITPQALKTFARQARKRMRTESGGYRRDHLRALAQRVEVDAQEVRIMGSKSVYCCARSSPLRAQKRRVLACPVLYRAGAPEGIRTSDLCLRRATLYPAELRARNSQNSPLDSESRGKRQRRIINPRPGPRPRVRRMAA